MLLSVCATTLSGCTATPQSMVHQKLCTLICAGRAVDRHLGDAGDLRCRNSRDRRSQARGRRACGPSPPSAPRARPTLMARGVFFSSSSRYATGSTPALARDLVHEHLGGEPVGQEADAAQRSGAHAGVAVELLDQLMRDVVAA